MSDQRKNGLTQEEIHAKIARRRLRTYGGIAVGVAALVGAFTVGKEQALMFVVVGAVAFGITDFSTIIGLIKK